MSDAMTAEAFIRRLEELSSPDQVAKRYLVDRPRDILYELARSPSPWERRTAIVSTYYFIRAGKLDDTFQIAEILVDDDHELVQKAVGSWLREAGKKDRDRHLAFLDRHAPTMPRVTLRYAVEKLEKALRAEYMAKRSDAGRHV